MVRIFRSLLGTYLCSARLRGARCCCALNIACLAHRCALQLPALLAARAKSCLPANSSASAAAPSASTSARECVRESAIWCISLLGLGRLEALGPSVSRHCRTLVHAACAAEDGDGDGAGGDAAGSSDGSLSHAVRAASSAVRRSIIDTFGLSELEMTASADADGVAEPRPHGDDAAQWTEWLAESTRVAERVAGSAFAWHDFEVGFTYARAPLRLRGHQVASTHTHNTHTHTRAHTNSAWEATRRRRLRPCLRCAAPGPHLAPSAPAMA